MNKIAALVDTFSVSQSSFALLNSFNELAKSMDVYCFYNNLSSMMTEAHFTVMGTYHMNSFKGNIFCTTIQNAKILLNLTSRSNKFLYLWDLEWIRSPYDFDETLKVLRSPELNLIARSIDHAQLIENYSNRKVDYILDDWNANQIREIINGRTTNN